MEKHSYDVEVGSEIANSLARTLKDSQRQLKQSEVNAKELEKSNKILTENIEKLKQENSRLTYELAGARDSKTAVKAEQAREEVENDVETADVQDIKEKYQKEKTKRRQVRQRCDALTAQLAETTGEGAALKKRIGELEEVLEKLKKDFESRKAISLRNKRKMLMDAIGQRPFERPQVQVGPVAKHSFNIATFRKFLSSIILSAHQKPKLQTVASADRSIFLEYSDPFLWSGKPGGHALLFAPCHKLQLNEVETKWIAHPMKEMYGTTKELFALNHNTAYYEGTYRCLPLSHEMIPGGCTDLSGLDLEALARATISDNRASYKLYQDHFQAVMDLWKSNILKAECIGLQYVGFNEGLYNALVPMGRKLSDGGFESTSSRVDARGKPYARRRSIIGHDDDRMTEYSGNYEHRAKRRRE
ncbi:uncharacterized protein EV420DRAFT_1659998 [Desarmillaria tabescens]|uniref:Uncharacterized protein n=1 Tax=Armillaria tabescens TaxID=1929756 RepID=A0AA39NPN7_ARMTA|nr:uncharacterized protein EV420DRAFT_1659998 [Desarmillaria tabescens]KAK0469516.1 hypothetical protein EV420DRAFT_1659998 [Desarmillaria tabescens]